MRNAIKKISLCILACLLAFTNIQTVSAKTELPAREAVFTPTVFLKEVTENTNSIPVYVYDNTTLYVKNGGQVIFQRNYPNGGLKNVKIARQAGGSKLAFYLVAKRNGKRGKTVTRTVKSLPAVAPETFSITMKAPNLTKCKLTNKTTKVVVTAYKGTTLVIKNEKKILKTVDFKKTGEKKITIPKQKSGTLYFYTRKGNLRSGVVTRTVQDVIAPSAPKLRIRSNRLYVKGEVGAKIYFRGRNGWRYTGVILTSAWQAVDTNADGGMKSFKVYLKDAAGNKGKVTQMKNKNAGKTSLPVD